MQKFKTVSTASGAKVSIVPEITLTLSLAQYNAIRAEIHGKGMLEGAWRQFQQVDGVLYDHDLS